MHNEALKNTSIVHSSILMPDENNFKKVAVILGQSTQTLSENGTLSLNLLFGRYPNLDVFKIINVDGVQ